MACVRELEGSRPSLQAGSVENPKRRSLIAGAGLSLLLAVLRSPSAIAAMRGETALIDLTAIAPPLEAEPLPFSLFFDLSRYLTARSQLDDAFARALFERFRKETWGWAQAARLYGLIRRELAAGTGSAPELLASHRLPPSEQWYGEHLVDAWYDGIYRYENREERVGYDKALMWQAVGDILPVQGLSDRVYGYWADLPAGTDGR